MSQYENDYITILLNNDNNINLTFKKIPDGFNIDAFFNTVDKQLQEKIVQTSKIKVTNEFLNNYQLLYLVKLSTILKNTIEYSFTPGDQYKDLFFTLQELSEWNEINKSGSVKFTLNVAKDFIIFVFDLTSVTKIYIKSDFPENYHTLLQKIAEKMGINNIEFYDFGRDPPSPPGEGYIKIKVYKL